jgi:hypothetical protein
MTGTKGNMLNLSHLDALGEDVTRNGDRLRIVHIYAEAPDYEPIADPEEGTACVDDAARAAVVYLRHFELHGDQESLSKARALLRFIMYMQNGNGLFYNFVINNRLDINKEHFRSRADTMEWWTARALWALGTGARVLRGVDDALAKDCVHGVRATLPHLKKLLERYPETVTYAGRTLPTWLICENASDATSEMLLGLVALNEAQPEPLLQEMIERFAEGIAIMQYGSMSTFPYGSHASWKDGWHGWGNAQTQALAEAGILDSAIQEAEHFYPRLLVQGWMNSIRFGKSPAIREFERIAYQVRCVAVGLIRLYEATGDAKYAVMAGLASSWLTGNNVAETPMYDPATGRGYDGLRSESEANFNAGAESTIEALYTILEIENHPEAVQWMYATGGPTEQISIGDLEYSCRMFRPLADTAQDRLFMAMNLTNETCEVFSDNLEQILSHDE